MNGKNIARTTDIAVGVCYCHKSPIPYVGVIIQGSENVETNNLKTARLSDQVVGCHQGTIVTSSNTVMANNLGVARIGDNVVGCPLAIIVTGSSDTYSGD